MSLLDRMKRDKNPFERYTSHVLLDYFPPKGIVDQMIEIYDDHHSLLLPKARSLSVTTTALKQLQTGETAYHQQGLSHLMKPVTLSLLTDSEADEETDMTQDLDQLEATGIDWSELKSMSTHICGRGFGEMFSSSTDFMSRLEKIELYHYHCNTPARFDLPSYTRLVMGQIRSALHQGANIIPTEYINEEWNDEHVRYLNTKSLSLFKRRYPNSVDKAIQLVGSTEQPFILARTMKQGDVCRIHKSWY